MSEIKTVISHKTIADLAGVARSTVTMALNGDVRISSDTRERIAKIARKLDYNPYLHLDARRMALRQSGKHKSMGIIGLLWTQMDGFLNNDPYFDLMLRGMGRAAYRLNKSILLLNIQAETDGVRLACAQTDGLICPLSVNEHLEEAVKLRKPVVTIAVHSPGFASLQVDNARAVEMAFEYLHARGHRHIGYLGPQYQYQKSFDAGFLRWDSYCRCLARHGLPLNFHHVVEDRNHPAEGFNNWYRAKGRLAMETLWRMPNRPTAVIAYNDGMALGALETCQRLGVRVPDELSIIGIDGLPVDVTAGPALTTVSTCNDWLGERAVELMDEFIESSTYSDKTIYGKLELIERETVRSLSGTASIHNSVHH